MVEKALVSGGIRFGTLRAVDQVTESFSGDLGREIAEEDTAFDDNWNRRQCHTDGGDAGGSIRVSLVTYQAIVRVGFMEIVQDRGELQQAEISVGQRSSEVGIAGHVSHESVDRFTQLHADAVGFSVVAERHCTGSEAPAHPTRLIERRDPCSFASVIGRFNQPRSSHRRLTVDSRPPSPAPLNTKADAPTSKDRCVTSGSFIAENTMTFASGFSLRDLTTRLQSIDVG